jgi:hypothetical protein
MSIPIQNVRILMFAACAVGGLSLSHQARATPMNANVAGAFGSADYIGDGSGSTLATTTGLNLSGVIITSVPANYTPAGGSSAPNTFMSLNTLTPVTSAATIIPLINLSSLPTGVLVLQNITDFMTFSGSAGTYEYNVTGLAVTLRSGTGFLNLETVGNLVDDSNNYATTAAGSSITLDQSGNTGGVSAAFSLGAPPSFTAPPSVPEPASIALFGVGLLALGTIRRHGPAL